MDDLKWLLPLITVNPGASVLVAIVLIAIVVTIGNVIANVVSNVFSSLSEVGQKFAEQKEPKE